MKLIEYALDGKVYHLLLNGTALFNCYDRFGTEKNLLDLIQDDNKESYAAATWMLAEFSRQGELYRRYIGEDPAPFLDPAQAATIVTPADIAGVKFALVDAIRVGFSRQHEDEAGYDPFLREIEQKKTPESHVRNIFGYLQKFLGSR